MVPFCSVLFLLLCSAGPLHKHSLGHWNSTVEGLAQNVLKMYMEFDIHLYDRYIGDAGDDAAKFLLVLSVFRSLYEGLPQGVIEMYMDSTYIDGTPAV